MNYIYIGKIVSTHGIKGEIRILSDFEYKDEIFKPGTYLYIGENYKKELITSYRHHKNYEMVMLEGYNRIEDVEQFLRKKVYIVKEEIDSIKNNTLPSELIGFDSYIDEKYIGKVNDIYYTGVNYRVFEIRSEKEKKLIPYHKDFIEKIDIDNKKIYFKGGMI